MKCINCGEEIDGGTPFCPMCGAAQNAVWQKVINNGQQPYVQSQPIYQPQPPYGQQPYEQQMQSQSQQPYVQQQQPYMQQQAYGNTSQQWQQPQYAQQFNQGYYQNNMKYPKKKKSKARLIICLIGCIICLVLYAPILGHCFGFWDLSPFFQFVADFFNLG